MRVTIQGLRRWIMAVAALLLAIVAGFFIYGRNRFRHIEKDLPARLGANIQQTANGFSYTQSSEGHTLFTLKASRLVQLKAGHALLHDVDITLYGPPGSGREDRIYGSDFDYDQSRGVAVSKGEVNIDIEGMGTGPGSAGAQPAANAAPPAGSSAPASADDGASGGPESNTIHVRTSGLTFLQKTGEASTAQLVQFQLPRAAGSSVGANYNSRTGVLILDSDVHITTSSNGQAAVVSAAHATLLRANMQALLDSATLDYEAEKGSSDHATVWFRKDGTTEKIDASGHVHMAMDSGAIVDSDSAHILLDRTNQPTRADLGGGVQFSDARDTESMHGSAREGTLLFVADPAQGGRTELQHGEFRQQVKFLQQITGLPHDPRGRTEKQLQAQVVDVDFAAAGPGHEGEKRQQTQATKATADGAPVLTTAQFPSKGPQQSTRISGDHLIAMFAPGNLLRVLDGSGHTHILNESSDGARDTTQGDTLHATFAQEAGAGPQKAGAAQKAAGHATFAKAKSGKAAPGASGEPPTQTVLESAVQDGNVMLTEMPARKAGETAQPAPLTAWAQHADYHASDQLLHLTGSPRIADGQSMQMSAEAIDYHRDTQDASGAGNVKATYTQPPQKTTASANSAPPTLGGSGPVHVIAERAALHHATNESDFYGSPQRPARLWQEADSLLAPVIQIDRNKDVLKAWGENTGSEPVVNANFTTAMGENHQQTLVRVHSQTLTYSDKERRGEFHGSVVAEQANDVIRCDDALVFLKPAAQGVKSSARGGTNAKAEAPKAPGQPGQSQIERMVATGDVLFTEPGRRATGSKLVYTADTGEYVLTGTPGEPPRMMDRVHGSTTGEALLFNSQNDSVEVSGGKSSAVTDTRAPK